jgi:ferritin-like metal-binding protein YciE
VKLQNLRDLWVDELKDLYHAEHQILKALPKMVKAAVDEELMTAFEEHLEQTRGHVERLERVFEQIDEAPKGKRCKGMEGIIAEGKEMLDLDLPDPLGDAALIAAAQRVEHYEIAAYGTVRTYAELLGESDAAALLEETLNEEKETDERLTVIAESVNPEAEEPDGTPDDEDTGRARNGTTKKKRQPVGAGR